MGFTRLKDTLDFLGPLYTVRVIDGVECIHRVLDDSHEIEVVGFFGQPTFTVNLWQRSPHTELLAIYSGVACKEDLADTLGHLAFKYRNLSARIQVEREDPSR